MDATITAPGKSVAPFSTLFELPNMQLPKFDLSKMEGLEAFRDAAEKGVAQSKDAYEKVKTAAEEASKLLEDAYATSAKSARVYNRKVIEAGRSNVNASFDYALALLAARSLSEVVELSAAHIRDQLAAAIQQAEEFTVIVRNAATETVEPIRMGVNKAFQKAARLLQSSGTAHRPTAVDARPRTRDDVTAVRGVTVRLSDSAPA